MWEARVDFIKRENLDFVAELFCESTNKDPFQTHQISERLRGHAMLISSDNSSHAVEFDHDEFRRFFLGECIYSLFKGMDGRAKAELVSVFRRGPLAKQAQHSFIRCILRDESITCKSAVDMLMSVSSIDSKTSYAHSNCSEIIIRLLNNHNSCDASVSNILFGIDALRRKKLFGVKFIDCFFSATSAEESYFEGCVFVNCNFVQLRMFQSTKTQACTMDNCTIESIAFPEHGRDIWQPSEVVNIISKYFVVLNDDIPAIAHLHVDTESLDEEIVDFQKLLRYFMRSTTIGENVAKKKIGVRGNLFISEELPRLLACHVFKEIPNKGAGVQRRFRLGASLQRVRAALSKCNGSFDSFLAFFEQSQD
jgi:hypothetical protein